MDENRDLHRIDLNLLVALDALLGEQHVTKAAVRLSIGQSAMSATLARLRRLFDDPLLVRHGRAMELTPFAESLIEPLGKVLTDVHHMLQARGTYDPTTMRRSFRITATDYVALIFLQPLMVRLAAEAPMVRLEINTFGEDYYQRLHRNETDLLIAPHEVVDAKEGLLRAPLFEERYVALVDRDNPLVGDHLTREGFHAIPRMATSAGVLPTIVEKYMERAGLWVRSDMTVSTSVAPFMVQGTPFVTIAPARLAAYAAQYHPLKVLEVPFELPPFHETMYWSRRTDRDPSHRWLREWLADHAAQMSARAELATDYSAIPEHMRPVGDSSQRGEDVTQ